VSRHEINDRLDALQALDSERRAHRVTCAELATAEERIAELESALRPFASCYAPRTEGSGPDEVMVGPCGFCAGCKARAALSGEERS
jgi:hypothetical protein